MIPLDRFIQFTDPLEGCLCYMYLDTLGLVTIGRGNLIDPVSYALTLPFVDAQSGVLVTQDRVHEQWSIVKGRQDLKLHGGGAFRALTNVMLTRAGVDALTSKKLYQVWTTLASRFTGFEQWPADAQLGLVSMAWAMGPAFSFPNFHAACDRRDFAEAARQCHMTDKGGNAIEKRNAQDVVCFNNAAKVLEQGLCTTTLNWPNVL